MESWVGPGMRLVLFNIAPGCCWLYGLGMRHASTFLLFLWSILAIVGLSQRLGGRPKHALWGGGGVGVGVRDERGGERGCDIFCTLQTWGGWALSSRFQIQVVILNGSIRTCTDICYLISTYSVRDYNPVGPSATAWLNYDPEEAKLTYHEFLLLHSQPISYAAIVSGNFPDTSVIWDDLLQASSAVWQLCEVFSPCTGEESYVSSYPLPLQLPASLWSAPLGKRPQATPYWIHPGSSIM